MCFTGNVTAHRDAPLGTQLRAAVLACLTMAPINVHGCLLLGIQCRVLTSAGEICKASRGIYQTRPALLGYD